MAKHLNLGDEVVGRLLATLKKEKATDEKLSRIAKQGGNQAATMES